MIPNFRILVILDSLYTGGAEFSTLSLYGWLVRKGYDVKLVCLKRVTPAYDPALFGFGDTDYLVSQSFWEKRTALQKIINDFEPSLVHSVLFSANMLVRSVRLVNNTFIHLESLVNEMYSPQRLADPRVTRVKLEGYRLLDWITQKWGVDHFHANGVSVSQHYQQKLGINPQRITIIPRGRKPNPFLKETAVQLKIRQELAVGHRLMLVTVGRHEFQKGQEVMLEALHQLKPEQRKEICWVVAGREGNYTALLKEKINTYRLEQQVMLIGHRNDVPALLATADGFVFPSRFEGLPGALIEAEAAGLPLLCSDIPNNREVAEENRNALFFPVNNSEQLAKQLEKLIANNQLRESMGKESLRIFEERFNLEQVHARMEQLLVALVAANNHH